MVLKLVPQTEWLPASLPRSWNFAILAPASPPLAASSIYLVVTLWKLCRLFCRAACAPATRVTGSWSLFPPGRNFSILKFIPWTNFFLTSPLHSVVSGAIQERRFFGILRSAKRKDGKWLQRMLLKLRPDGEPNISLMKPIKQTAKWPQIVAGKKKNQRLDDG